MMITTRWRGSALIAAALAAAWAAPVRAIPDLPIPQDATPLYQSEVADGRYALPVAPWDRGTGLATRIVEGTVITRTWRVRRGLTAQQIVRPLRDALSEAGWRVLLDCNARECGGFDFRFATRVVPAPDMFVDIAAFRFVAMAGPDGAVLSALASADPVHGYLQVIHATDGPATAPPDPAPMALDDPAPDGPVTSASNDPLLADIAEDGQIALPDLVFETGAVSLGDGPIASLDRLAAFLQDNPDLRALLVGHTDAVGSLENNLALSRRRAEAAARYMLDRHGLDPAQIGAEGAGFLAPVASNLVPEGRERNRRVDAIILPRD